MYKHTKFHASTTICNAQPLREPTIEQNMLNNILIILDNVMF